VAAAPLDRDRAAWVQCRAAGAVPGSRVVVPRPSERHPRLRRELDVTAPARLLFDLRAWQVDVESWERARMDDRPRFALVLEVAEEVDAILPDGTTYRRADLLIRVRQHAILHEVLRDEAVVAEVTSKRPRHDVRARLADGVHLHRHRTALRGIEAV